MTSIALLSHRFGNIGHNFMALGAEEAAREAFGPDVRITHFEQHHPFSVYPKYHWLRLVDQTRHGRFQKLRRYLGREDVYQRLWRQSRRLEFNLAVACGGPNLVAGAAGTPEMRILMHHFNGAFRHAGIPLLDAAVGSCFPLERVPEHLAPEDAAFYRRSLSLATDISVRDSVAARLYRTLGADPAVIPCIAIGSGRALNRSQSPTSQSGQNGNVVINFQAKGSNDDWGQHIDARAWMALVRGVIEDLRHDGHPVVLICHSAYEARLARELAPALPILEPKTEEDYGRAIANAKAGFVSRIHAAVALAGVGVPSLVVGNDTRIGTTLEMGLPSVFTKAITRQTAIAELRRLIAGREPERDRLINLRENVIKTYAALFLKHAKYKT